MTQSAQPIHPRNLAAKHARAQIQAALAYFAPGESSTSLTRLFAGRATPAQIRGWRLGRNGAPQWAIDLLARALAERARNDLETAASLVPGLGKGHCIGSEALHRWRLQRALERERAPD